MGIKDIKRIRIKAIIRIDCICPGCKHGFCVFFNNDEILMSGKNYFCPECRNTLWIPKDLREKITIFRKKNKKEKERRRECSTFCHNV
ncbi:hypothetical protein COY96_00755 [Candidatus Wolfebacteria bacterium CG_4_10_14_0_8_um_filter_37_11]|uniref:Uncharacterized protein n=1 Tax=Candidatus Wolfebacteria bacterium CG_4_10_14_0_8_um_filter_37_11 TaxID=1975062 RepID=A0A2M7Q929_9BACT|nr:MAG: hypothetical protein COY96_00755 [Candidatus Wolfebacteria bacterium CG_4_10_14_0_8_um_filter_37_11]